MKFKKVLAQLAAGALLAVGAVVGFASPAQAAIITGALDPPGTLGGSGWYAVDTTNNTLDLSVNAAGMAAGYCLTVYVDVTRGGGGHYDARAARTCRPYSQRASGLQYEGSTYGIDITGVNKVAICYGVNNSLGTCRTYTGSVSTVDPEASSNNTCTRFWSRASNNTTYYFGAGNVFSCSS